MDHAIETSLARDLAEPRKNGLSFEARLKAHAEKSGPVALVVDLAYLLAAIAIASAFLAMLAIAAPVALALAALAGLFLGGEAPKAWRPVRIR